MSYGGIGWILSKLNNLSSCPIVVKSQNAYRLPELRKATLIVKNIIQLYCRTQFHSKNPGRFLITPKENTAFPSGFFNQKFFRQVKAEKNSFEKNGFSRPEHQTDNPKL